MEPLLNIRVPTKDFTNEDLNRVKHFAKLGLAPAINELRRREALPKPTNNNTTGNKGVPRRRIVTYADNTEVEHGD